MIGRGETTSCRRALITAIALTISATYTCPDALTAMPWGLLKVAAAKAPSAEPAVAAPASVVTAQPSAEGVGVGVGVGEAVPDAVGLPPGLALGEAPAGREGGGEGLGGAEAHRRRRAMALESSEKTGAPKEGSMATPRGLYRAALAPSTYP